MMILSRLLTGAQISIHADIGAGLEIFHASGLVIGKNVKIGENVWLFHNVTIGSSGTGQPLVGSGVKIFTGAVVAGDINIGDRAVIGANAVVLSDVQEDMLVESPKSSFRSNAIS